jgi:signal transduction histidine kinase
VKLWTADGRIVYSDETRLIDRRFSLEGEEKQILRRGGSAADVSDLSRPENRFERRFGQLLQVYTRVDAHSTPPLLFEAYFSYDDIARRSQEVLNAFRPITIAGLLAFLALTGSLVWVLARRLDAAAASRERLLLAAVDASDAERRRIARDLHDGVVQDLAGTSFALSAAARDVADRPAAADALTSLGIGVRQSLRSLRSLLVEIYPPNLATEGLAAALDDLVAPLAAAGVQVHLDVADSTSWPHEVTALVWRGAQEAVRNATQHGRPHSVAVRVGESVGAAVLEVSDDGSGFGPEQIPEQGHFGLRGLRDLATEAGGRLDVTSSPGMGTRVVLEVPIR